MPTLPLLSGIFFTSQSMVSYVSVELSTGVGFSGPRIRAVHYVVALGTILAAHVLDHPDITALDDHLGGVVVALEARPQVGAAF